MREYKAAGIDADTIVRTLLSSFPTLNKEQLCVIQDKISNALSARQTKPAHRQRKAVCWLSLFFFGKTVNDCRKLIIPVINEVFTKVFT